MKTLLRKVNKMQSPNPWILCNAQSEASLITSPEECKEQAASLSEDMFSLVLDELLPLFGTNVREQLTDNCCKTMGAGDNGDGTAKHFVICTATHARINFYANNTCKEGWLCLFLQKQGIQMLDNCGVAILDACKAKQGDNHQRQITNSSPPRNQALLSRLRAREGIWWSRGMGQCGRLCGRAAARLWMISTKIKP